MDIPLGAFIPWRISDEAAPTNAVVGIDFVSGYGASDVELDVLDGLGNDVNTSAGDDVVSTVCLNSLPESLRSPFCVVMAQRTE